MDGGCAGGLRAATGSRNDASFRRRARAPQCHPCSSLKINAMLSPFNYAAFILSLEFFYCHRNVPMSFVSRKISTLLVPKLNQANKPSAFSCYTTPAFE